MPLLEEPPEELLKEVNCTLEHYRSLSEEDKLEVLGLLDHLEIGRHMLQFYNSTAEADAADAQGRLVAERQRKMRVEAAERWARDTLKTRRALRKIMYPIGNGKKPSEA